MPDFMKIGLLGPTFRQITSVTNERTNQRTSKHARSQYVLTEVTSRFAIIYKLSCHQSYWTYYCALYSYA